LLALGILPGTEDIDGLVVRGAEGFEAFEGLLAVIQAGGEAVDA